MRQGEGAGEKDGPAGVGQVWVPFLTDNVPSPFPLAVREKASFCLVCTGLGERRGEVNSQDQEDGPVGKVLV